MYLPVFRKEAQVGWNGVLLLGTSYSVVLESVAETFTNSCGVEGDEASIAVFWRLPLCNSCLCCCKIMKAIILLKGHQALIFISGAAQ